MSFERRKVRVGRVVSDKMDKTIVVEVEWRRAHPLYRKAVRRRTRFKAHDHEGQCRTGDLVRIIESRPISKTKRWRVSEVLARVEIAEVQPEEIAIDEVAIRGTRVAPEVREDVAPAEAEAVAEVEVAEAEEESEEEPAEAEAVAEVEAAEAEEEAEEESEEEPAEEQPTSEPDQEKGKRKRKRK